jgi:hypothetical protein
MISGILNFDCICTWLKKQPRFVEKQTETCLRSSQTRRPVEKMIPAESVSVLICSTFWRRFGNFYRPSSRFSGMSKNPVKFSVSPVLPWPLHGYGWILLLMAHPKTDSIHQPICLKSLKLSIKAEKVNSVFFFIFASF